MILRNPFSALKIRINKANAENITVTKYGYNGHNDKSDAFRHAYFQAINARACDETIARQFSNAHEETTPTALLLEKQMDLHNNDIGFAVAAANPGATDAVLATKVMAKITAGECKYLTPLDASINNAIIPGLTQIKNTN